MTAIRTVGLAEQDAVMDTLMLAFSADPVARYWWPAGHDFLNWGRRFMGLMGENGFAAGGVTVAGDFAGAAIWLPPGVEPDGEKLAALDLPGDEEDEAISGELREAMDRYHPKDPHWYLWMIGVDPHRQGTGVGSALLRHTLAKIDAAGEVAYLESSDPKNVPLYERLGFEVLGIIEVRDVPPLTPMIRRPR